ncbi:hypothetical protein HOLleu_03397 [Holothuria leucospilota]|uniref:Transposable element P transposase-like RNase H domain-containing protein n=1 Tax=Holothuria leucospilota TaxID=206669 RepID=A0A9Q1HLV9_HOLLE|nr:hypothetical protein HOLleu_03397 [Holothuria leucospilota]
MEKFERRFKGMGQEDQQLASHVLLFMVHGLTSGMNFPMAYFATTNVTGAQLTETSLKCIKALELMGLKVLCLTSDGASSNRKLYEMLSGDSGKEKPEHKAPNLFERGKDLYFICDVPHLLKTIRNNFENSNWNHKTRKLVVSNLKHKPLCYIKSS